MMHSHEDIAFVFVAVETVELVFCNQIAKKGLRRIIRSNSSGHNQPCTPIVSQYSRIRLSEERVGIDLTNCREKESSAVSYKFALCLGCVLSAFVVIRQSRIGLSKHMDHPLARGRIWCVCDVRSTSRKEFLFLELHGLPRWVSQHAVEAILVEYIGNSISQWKKRTVCASLRTTCIME